MFDKSNRVYYIILCFWCEPSNNLGSLVQCWETPKGIINDNKEIEMQQKEKLKPEATEKAQNKAIKDYFSFHKLISINIIKILYVIGIISIIIEGILYMSDEIDYMIKYGWKYGDPDTIAIGFGIIFLGNILWRVLCEGWIVFFKIHDQLDSIEKK